MRTIDANVILRYLTNDVPAQAERAEALLKRIEDGEETVYLPDILLADIIWVLEKFYKQPRSQIRELITVILTLEGLQYSNKNTALEALDIYAASNIDWSDALTSSLMLEKGITEIYSFDKHFNRIKKIKRVEP